MTPARDELLRRMADYLDDLLDDDERRAAEEDIARDPAALAEVARLRATLYRPYRVPPPGPGQRERILARHRDRPWRRVARYAAVFVAGALTALAVRTHDPAPPRESTRPEIRDDAPRVAATVLPRRIR